MMSRSFGLIALFFLCSGCSQRGAQTVSTTRVPHIGPTPWHKPSPKTLINHAKIFDGVHEAFEGGLLMEHGVVVDVGPHLLDATLPGVNVVNAEGRFVTPGVIDIHSHMGVYPVPEVSAHEDGNEASSPVTAHVRAIDGFWPQDPALGRALASGVTTIQILPGSANLIGGAGAVLHTVPKLSAEAMLFPESKPTLKMACGENPKRVYGGRNAFPSTRMGNVAGYRDAMQDALEYKRKWDAYAAKTSATDDKPSEESTEGDAPEAPERDYGLERLASLIRGETLLQMHCYRADEMLNMIEMFKSFGVKVSAFHHAVEAYKIRDVLAREGISIATWADWWGFKMEAYDAIQENIALLHLAGVNAVVHSDSPYLVQHLNQEAGKVLAQAARSYLSIPVHEAIAWFTLNAAKAVGIDHLTGSLEAGKHADVVIWNGHPLSVYATAGEVFVDGHLVSNGNLESDFELSAHSHGSDDVLPPKPAWNPPMVVAEISDDFVGVRTPMLVNIGSGLGLAEVELEDSTNDMQPTESTQPLRPSFAARDAFYPMSELLPVALREGVGFALATPKGGLISGTSMLFSLLNPTASEAIVKTPTALHINLVTADSVSGARPSTFAMLREAFDEALRYKQNPRQYTRHALAPLRLLRQDLETLALALEQKIPVMVEVSRADDIDKVITWAEQYRLKIILLGAHEAWLRASVLKDKRIPVFVTPSMNLPGQFSSRFSRKDTAAILEQAGVTVGIYVGDPWQARTLRQEAGIAVQFGMTHDAALKAITEVPLQALGIVLQDAPEVIWTADPLETSSYPLYISAKLCANERCELPRSRQTQLFTRYETLR